MNATITSGPNVRHNARLPFVFGCAFMALICFPGLADPPGGMTIAHAVMFASIPFWFGAAAMREVLVLDRTAAFGATIILVCLAFLIIWAFLSALGSSVPFKSGRTIVTIITGFACFFLIVGTVTRDRHAIYVDILCLTLAFTCLVSVIGYFEPRVGAMIFNGTDRASGFFKNPNQFGMAISTILPVATAVLLAQKDRKIMWSACVAALILGLVLSGSKTNLMISTATITFVLWCYTAIAYSGIQRIWMMGMSLLALGVLLIVNVFLLSVFNPRALSLFQAVLRDGQELQSISARSELWHRSVEQFVKDPIFGQGAGHPIDAFYADQLVTHSHNVLLDYLRTLGAPGFFGLLIILVTVLALSISSMHWAFKAKGAQVRDRILCIGLATAPLAYVTANLSSDSMGPSTSPFFWAVVFLSLTARLLLQVDDNRAL